MNRIFQSRMMLIPLGIVVGIIVRTIFGGPTTEINSLQLDPYSKEKSESETSAEERQSEPLIKPIKVFEPLEIPMWRSFENVVDAPQQGRISAHDWLAQFDQFSHDPNAVFHAHGDKVCASGCAASHHPTEKLIETRYRTLLRQFARQPLSEQSAGLEELLYFGPQTLQMIQTVGTDPLDFKRAKFLKKQLQYGHAKVSIRVVDEYGNIRSWNDPTKVPFDRRHVFEMKTDQVQDLVTSGTVKRVGLHHIWVRL